MEAETGWMLPEIAPLYTRPIQSQWDDPMRRSVGPRLPPDRRPELPRWMRRVGPAGYPAKPL